MESTLNFLVLGFLCGTKAQVLQCHLGSLGNQILSSCFSLGGVSMQVHLDGVGVNLDPPENRRESLAMLERYQYSSRLIPYKKNNNAMG